MGQFSFLQVPALRQDLAPAASDVPFDVVTGTSGLPFDGARWRKGDERLEPDRFAGGNAQVFATTQRIADKRQFITVQAPRLSLRIKSRYILYHRSQ